MTRRQVLGVLGSTALGGTMLMATRRTGTAQDRRPPNVVIILADDLGYGDVGCYGNTRIRTPHLDRLAAEGVRFTDFHSSGAVCSPTRAGLVTGLYQQRVNVPGVITAAHHRHHGLSTREVTFPKLLKAAGYATGIFGKWHLGYQPKFSPVHHGFDRFRGYVSGNVDYLSHIDQTGVPDWWDGTRQITEEGYTTHLIRKHSLAFIEANRGRPFCLYMAHEAPHYPYQRPGDPAIRSPGSTRAREKRPKNIPAIYKVMVEEMDKTIGEVVAALERLGLERDTLVFFFSDNGACRHGSNAPLRGFKASLWEGGHRVPAIAWWPGSVPRGRTCDELTISLDLFPTLVEVAGATMPEGLKLDGVSLVPLLTQGRPLGERTLFWRHARQRAVRQGPWKLVVDGKRRSRKAALFHLADDLGEKKDLSEDRPERAAQMLAALNAWEREVGAEDE